MFCWKCFGKDSITEILDESHCQEVAYVKWRCECGVINNSRVFVKREERSTRGLLVLGGNLYASDEDKYLLFELYKDYFMQFDYVVTIPRRGASLNSIYIMNWLGKRSIAVFPLDVPWNMSFLRQRDRDDICLVPHSEYINKKHPIYEGYGNSQYDINRFAPYLQAIKECTILADEALIFDNNLPGGELIESIKKKIPVKSVKLYDVDVIEPFYKKGFVI